LTEANSSLRAANTLTLAREEREIAERIKDAKDDPDQQVSAYTGMEITWLTPATYMTEGRSMMLCGKTLKLVSVST